MPPAATTSCPELFRLMTPPKLVDSSLLLTPCICRVRPSSVKDRLLLLVNVVPPCATVVPLPLSVSEPENDDAPLTVSVPVPVSVPPDRVRLRAVGEAPSRLSVLLPLILTAPTPDTVPFRSAAPVPLTVVDP